MSIRGRFVWEELMTTDVPASAAFYNKVSGLTTEKAPWDPNYTLFQASGSTMGGAMPLPDEAKSGGTQAMWMSYIGTPDADDTARRITALGGKVHKGPWDIAEGGRIAIVADPQGAMFAIYANPKATGAPPAPKLGHASWHELATSDFAAGFLFYQTVFGWHVVNDMDMGPGMGMYRLFAPEGMTEAFGGMYTKPPQPDRPASWLPYIKVANVKAATDKAKSLGATIFHGPAQVPGGGWITMGADPQGAAFAVHSTPGTATSPTKARAGKKKSAVASPKRNAKPSAKAGAKKKKARPTKKSKAARKAKKKVGSKK